jgi:predicted nucleic acid-binding Zn ribbon protein
MESGSIGLKETAFSFQNNARKLEEEVRKRQRRLYILMGLIVICVLVYIIVPIVIKFKKKKIE